MSQTQLVSFLHWFHVVHVHEYQQSQASGLLQAVLLRKEDSRAFSLKANTFENRGIMAMIST